MAKLGDVCEILDSKRIPITASDRIAGPYPYYGANGVQDYVNDYIFDDELVLLAEDGGNFGSKEKPIAYRISGKCWVNNHAHVLKPKPGLDVDYLCYSLMFYDVSSIVNGATRQKLTQADMRKMEIPMRSMEEQIVIVAQLSKASHMVLLRKQELQTLDDLIKARFVELSSQWEMQNEPEPLYAYLNDITYGFTNPMPDADEGPWKITAKDVVDGHINLGTARKTTQEAFDSLTAKSKPEVGSVLLTKDGTLGRTAIVEDNNICVNQSVAILKTNNRLLPKFLEVLLRIPVYQREMLKDSGGGTIQHIYITKVDKMLIVVPDLKEQESFINYVSQVDFLKSTVQKALDKAQLLFDSLMQQYFG